MSRAVAGARSGGGGGTGSFPSIGQSLWRAVSGGRLDQLFTLAVLAVTWQVGAALTGSILIPSFTDTVAALGVLLVDGDLWEALVRSNEALVIGFACSVVVGVPLGLAMGRFRSIERFTDFYLTVLLVTPMAAITPLLIMATGLGLASRVILVVLSSIVIVVVNSRTGVRQVDPALLDMARSFQATEWQLWRRVVLPAALPSIMAGIRLGLSQAVGAMIIIELLLIAVGIGALMLEFRGRFLGDFLYATVLIVVFEALLLARGVNWLERRMVRWRT